MEIKRFGAFLNEMKKAYGEDFSLRDIKAGDVLTEDKLIAKRPAHGISPVHWDELIGRTSRIDIEEDALLKWDWLS